MVLFSHSPSLVVNLSMTLLTYNLITFIIKDKMVEDYLYLMTKTLDLSVPSIQHLSSLKMYHGVNLINVPKHSLLCYHSAGNPFCFLWRNLQQQSKTFKSNVVIKFGGCQKIVFNDGMFQDRHPIRHDRLLMGLEQGLKLGQLRPLDQPVQVHLLQDVEAGQVGRPLVLVQVGQHP